MACHRPDWPTLAIPDNAHAANAPSPSGNSSTTQTGRPSLWRASAQRKMTRLYVYTTLSLDKILEVVNVASPAEAAPGKDSANKKLSAMLDKEPRWLHPRTTTDMGRRVDQLSHSPTRSPILPDSTFNRPKSISDPHPLNRFSVANANLAAPDVSPFAHWPSPSPGSTLHGNDAFTDETAFSHGPAQAPRVTTAPPGDGRAGLRRTGTDTILDAFLRRTTHMTSSTDHTTGTFHRLLPGKSESYIQTVRRLVKRFTLQVNPRMSMSPISERPQTSWDDDVDAPPFSDRPFPLAGDYLNPEAIKFPQPQCMPGSEQHEARRCLCYVDDDLPESPWVSANGLTPNGLQILRSGVTEYDVRAFDDFGNTVLHFLVVRGTIQGLVNALQTNLCGSILNHRNTAGQTFLHLVTTEWLRNYESLNQLLQLLQVHGFDMYKRDHYGRNIFHVFHYIGIDLEMCLHYYDASLYSKRDAFNTVPQLQSALDNSFTSPLAQGPMDLDALGVEPANPNRMSEENPEVAREAKLLQQVRLAYENPQLEDESGNNGLHCLAMVSLSVAKVAQQAALELPTSPDRPKKKGADPFNQLDSSKEKLQQRLSYVNSLIVSGVDLNHYNHAGNTPLMAFAAELPEDDDYKTGREILELLIDKGANIHARNRAGETALHIAVRCGRKLAVRALVEKGANVHVRDVARRSLLDVADVKMASSDYNVPREYSHFEACRAWLSGQGHAVQCPTAHQEWSV